MSLRRLTWTAFPKIRLLEQHVYFLSCVRGLSGQCEFAEERGTFDLRAESGESLSAAFLPVTREVRELEGQCVASWLNWVLQISGSPFHQEIMSGVLDLAKGVGLTGSLNQRLGSLNMRQRTLWTAILALFIRRPGVLVLILSGEFVPDSEKESRALREQLAQLASSRGATVLVAGVDRRPFAEWDCIEFRGYPRKSTEASRVDFEDVLEADDAA